MRVPVSAGSFLDGRTLAEANLELETGYYLLAIRRGGPLPVPAAGTGDARGGRRADRDRAPRKAARASPSLGGYRVLEDDATGEIALVRVDS